MAEQMNLFKGNRIDTINIHCQRPVKPVEESKGAPKSFRFTPTQQEGIERAARAERVSVNAFIEQCAEVGIHFSLEDLSWLIAHRDMLLKLRNYPQVQSVLLALP